MDEDKEAYYLHVSSMTFIVVIFFVTLTGLVCNTLALVTVQRSSSLRVTFAATLISALAVVDSLVLVMDFLNNWVEYVFSADLISISRAGCTAYRYLFDVIYTTSAWYVVTLGIERFIVVWFPLKARVLCSRKTGIIASCVVPVLVAIIYGYQLAAWDLDDATASCDFHEDHLHMMSNVHPWLTAVFYSYAPIVILFILSIAIAVKLCCARDNKISNAERNLTRMVFLVCVLFLFLTVPLTVYYIVLFGAGGHVYQGPEMALVETIILILALTNHAINFFLYVVSSPKFRKELKKLCCCSKGQDGKEEDSEDTDTEDNGYPMDGKDNNVQT